MYCLTGKLVWLSCKWRCISLWCSFLIKRDNHKINEVFFRLKGNVWLQRTRWDCHPCQSLTKNEGILLMQLIKCDLHLTPIWRLVATQNMVVPDCIPLISNTYCKSKQWGKGLEFGVPTRVNTFSQRSWNKSPAHLACNNIFFNTSFRVKNVVQHKLLKSLCMEGNVWIVYPGERHTKWWIFVLLDVLDTGQVDMQLLFYKYTLLNK